MGNINPATASFFEVASHGDLAAVLQRLHTEQDINKPEGEEGLTPLMGAAANGNLPVVRALLDASADINTGSLTAATALYFACSGGHEDVAEELIQRGADVNIVETVDGWNPLMEACSKGHKNLIPLLLSAGCPIDSRSYAGDTALHIAASYSQRLVASELIKVRPELIDMVNDKGWTPLHSACWEGASDVVAILLESGAYVEAKCKTGETPIYLASLRGSIEALELLIEARADVNAYGTENRCRPLMVASMKGNIDVVHSLISAGAEVDAMCANGCTALGMAAEEGQELPMVELLRAGADVNFNRGPFGWTPLMAAALSEFPEPTRLLLAAGANVHILSRNGETALHIAAAKGNLAVVQELLFSSSIDVDAAETEHGLTALMYAAEAGFLGITQALIAAGAKPDIVNKEGLTASDFATAKGHELVATSLRTPRCLIEAQ